MIRRTRPFRRLIAAIAGFALLIPATPAGAAVTTLEAELAGGDAEVPDPGDPDGTGGARITVNVRKEKVCFTLVVLDITLPTAAAHIHEGEAGVAGDIVGPADGPGGDREHWHRSVDRMRAQPGEAVAA